MHSVKKRMAESFPMFLGSLLGLLHALNLTCAHHALLRPIHLLHASWQRPLCCAETADLHAGSAMGAGTEGFAAACAAHCKCLLLAISQRMAKRNSRRLVQRLADNAHAEGSADLCTP